MAQKVDARIPQKMCTIVLDMDPSEEGVDPIGILIPCDEITGGIEEQNVLA